MLTARQVDTLRTTYSWFACHISGEEHRGGNKIWYYTQGNDDHEWGYIFVHRLLLEYFATLEPPKEDVSAQKQMVKTDQRQ